MRIIKYHYVTQSDCLKEKTFISFLFKHKHFALLRALNKTSAFTSERTYDLCSSSEHHFS